VGDRQQARDQQDAVFDAVTAGADDEPALGGVDQPDAADIDRREDEGQRSDEARQAEGQQRGAEQLEAGDEDGEGGAERQALGGQELADAADAVFNTSFGVAKYGRAFAEGGLYRLDLVGRCEQAELEVGLEFEGRGDVQRRGLVAQAFAGADGLW